jgi:hypothetical protein
MNKANAIGALQPLSPRGRGREAMTYGRVHNAIREHDPPGAAVSHLAELVRGNSLPWCATKAPSSGPSGHLLPKGRWAAAAPFGAPLPGRRALRATRSARASRVAWSAGAELC